MKRFLCAAAFLMSVTYVFAQDDLLAQLEQQDSSNKEKNYVIQTFKGTRIINGMTEETKPAGALEFIISHRFGTINSGGYNFFGLDEGASIRLGLEYGVTDDLSVSVGRSSYNKTYDGYIKYKALKQVNGGMPVTVTAMGALSYFTFRMTPEYPTGDRIAFAAEAMIARKFGQYFSLQLTPVWIHRNRVDLVSNNDVVALGVAGRLPVTRSMSVVGEYYARLTENAASPNYNAVGVGMEIETGGHVFSLVFTNAQPLETTQFITQTADDFFDGGIRFGFNITRTFQLTHSK